MSKPETMTVQRRDARDEVSGNEPPGRGRPHCRQTGAHLRMRFTATRIIGAHAMAASTLRCMPCLASRYLMILTRLSVFGLPEGPSMGRRLLGSVSIAFPDAPETNGRVDKVAHNRFFSFRVT